MFPQVILAHGALGNWDEIIFVTVAVLFIVMMAITWVQARATDAPPKLPQQPSEPTAEGGFELD